jgi:hypothetical protein
LNKTLLQLWKLKLWNQASFQKKWFQIIYKNLIKLKALKIMELK